MFTTFKTYGRFYTYKICLQAFYLHKAYMFRHWLFQWKQDEEGDIVFSVANRLHFLKYKEHTIIMFGKKEFQIAPKYVRGE